MEENFYIDQYGKPYIEDESLPAGGGLDKRCDFIGDALHCFYNLKSAEEISQYLEARGFEEEDTPSMDLAIFEKGNTQIIFESYSGGVYGYVHVEYIEPEEE